MMVVMMVNVAVVRESCMRNHTGQVLLVGLVMVCLLSAALPMDALLRKKRRGERKQERKRMMVESMSALVLVAMEWHRRGWLGKQLRR